MEAASVPARSTTAMTAIHSHHGVLGSDPAADFLRLRVAGAA